MSEERCDTCGKEVGLRKYLLVPGVDSQSDYVGKYEVGREYMLCDECWERRHD